MEEKDIKQRIKECAVEHFNISGFYGTTIRGIAKDVDCSLPMIYYYYSNKKKLFDEIIKKDYFELLKKQAELLKIDDIVDFYTEYVFGLNFLSNYDKKVYRLGIKVYMTFDGDDELMQIMDEWEKTVIPRHYEILKPHLNNVKNSETIVRTLVHLLETLIQNIIVKNRFLHKNEIREEILIALRGCE